MKRIFLLLSGLMFCMQVWAVVDLNTANQAQLEGVNGIGPAKAKAIIDYRTKNGAFKSVDDLDKVSGFGKATITKIKAEVSVGGAKAAAPVKAGAPVAPVKAAAPVKPEKK